MARLSKQVLLNQVANHITEAGWQIIYLTRQGEHPAKIRVFQNGIGYIIKIYIWNITHGGGEARPTDEYRIQITGVPSLNLEPECKTLILGWWDEAGVYAGFDVRKHSGSLGHSPSFQIKESHLKRALINEGFSPYDKDNREIAVAFTPDFLVTYITHLEEIHDSGNLSKDLNILRQVADSPITVNDSAINEASNKRKEAIFSVRRALRDTSFKKRVLTAYSHRCAVCGVQLDLIDAAHIVPVVDKKSSDETSNGLALCALHHRAFDKRLIAVDDNYDVLCNPLEIRRLAAIGHDGGWKEFKTALRPMIILPPAIQDRPHIMYLRRGRQIRRWPEKEAVPVK
jgi:putative restriction endonuclease